MASAKYNDIDDYIELTDELSIEETESAQEDIKANNLAIQNCIKNISDIMKKLRK